MNKREYEQKMMTLKQNYSAIAKSQSHANFKSLEDGIGIQSAETNRHVKASERYLPNTMTVIKQTDDGEPNEEIIDLK